MKITNETVRQACLELLDDGISYDQMDCQAAVEEAYVRAGLHRRQIDTAGSNTHARMCYWVGTPERLCEILGIETVPVGVEMYINENDGGEPAKYRNDQMGDFTHMGLYMGDGQTFNSSEKMGGIVVSEKFDGAHEAVSGSWNMIGLKWYVDYGFSDDQLAILKADGNFVATNYKADDAEASADTSDAMETTDNEVVMTGVIDTSDFYPVKKGCKGGAVRRLQTWLIALGYDVGETGSDGDFGAATEGAVVSFQQAQSLEADGVVGKLTWAALAEAKFNA